jgi:pilus assembly protein Flp/PilA
LSAKEPRRAKPSQNVTYGKRDLISTVACRILPIRFAGAKEFATHKREPGQMRTRMFQLLQHFYRDDNGATAIEYGLICAGIAVAIITILQSLGTSLVALLSKLLVAIG